MKSGVYILINETKSTDELLEVKIGCSKNIDNRINQIKSSFRFNGNLDELSLWLKIPCNNYKLLEKDLHMLLNCWRYQNELFKCSEDEINKDLFKIDLNYYNK